MSKITFIDVSKWNSNVDYKSVKSAGVTGVIIQCGYGMASTQKDPYFEDNYKKAKAQGLKVGAYLYSYAESVSDAKKEANVCLKWIKGKKFDLPIYIDMEEEGLTYLGKSTLTKIATKFCKIVEKSGYKAGVYANANWFKSNLNYNSLKKKYSIWLAQYASYKDFDCDIWQYTDKLMINGKPFDGNYAYKTFEGKKKKYVKVKHNYFLRRKAFIDPVTKSNKPIAKLTKGTKVEWISDDGTGFSKVKYNGHTGYTLNTMLDKKGLSKYKTKVFPKGSKYHRIYKGAIKYSKTMDKARKFTIISYTEEGRFKGWYYVRRNGRYYFMK
jgi:GH25 family lysozyme M1 (1,4-beta-N-acetylmuramidase)